MPEIVLRPVEGTVVVRAGGAVIAESRGALELHEDGHDPVVYIPREDVGMAFLDPSPTRTTCPLKGVAAYFHIAAKSGPIRDAAWSYEAPPPPADPIAGMIAFDTGRAAVEVL